MFFNIILWSVFPFIYLISFFQFKSELKFKKNIAMGVTLPKEAQTSDEVKTILAKYGKINKNLTIVLMILSVAGFFIKSIEISMVLWSVMFWISLSAQNIAYAFCNTELKKLKTEKGWRISAGKTAEVDIKALTEFKAPSAKHFIIPVIISAVSIFFERDFWIVQILMIITEIFSYFGAVFLYRRKSETVDENTELTKELTQIRMNGWNKMWILSAYAVALTSISFVFMKSNPIFMTVLIVVLSLLIAGIAVINEFHVRKLQEKLTENSGKAWYKDEDDYWIFGTFYYNPNDSHLIANNRTGVNTTVNLAKPMGKVLAVFMAVLILFVPVSLIYFGFENNSTIELYTEENAVVCKNTYTTYKADFENIEEAELLDKMPDGMWRTAGTGMPDLYKGSFSAEKMNKIKVILSPKVSPYILIKTKTGEYYLFGARNSEITKKVYEEIK